MEDQIFKKLQHTAKNFQIISRGRRLTSGYFPDIVMQNGNEYIIMECDTGTSRKGFLGAFIKAAKFLSKEKQGVLIYVIKTQSNTKVMQIHNHIIPYFEWLSSLTNLRAIYLLSSDDYCADKPLKLFQKQFLKKALCVQKP